MCLMVSTTCGTATHSLHLRGAFMLVGQPILARRRPSEPERTWPVEPPGPLPYLRLGQLVREQDAQTGAVHTDAPESTTRGSRIVCTQKQERSQFHAKGRWAGSVHSGT